MLDGSVKHSRYPLNFHITPTVGLLNDPNGLIQFQGVYHIFYQWNPTGTTHTNKVWGHLTSPDLVQWERQPVALAPSEYYDQDGIYSGSAVVKDGLLYLFYTGNVIEEDGTKKSFQCMAVSKDGLTFEKQGPIFTHPEGYTRHVRDPKVWFEAESQSWYLLLGAQTTNLQGTVILYRSPDLRSWEFCGELLATNEIARLTQRGYMWECPDLFELGGKHFLVYSPQGLVAEGLTYQNIYQTVVAEVEPISPTNYRLTTAALPELDWGFDFYAPQSFVDAQGRRLLYGWMGVMPPEQEVATPTIAENWLHCLTIPRQLLVEEGQLVQKPLPELSRLRQTEVAFALADGFQETLPREGGELRLALAESSADWRFELGQNVSLTYEAQRQQLTLTRLNWASQALESRSVDLSKPLRQLQLFIDGSAIEIFVNGGESVASARFFETAPLELRLSGNLAGEGIWSPFVAVEVQPSSFA